MTDIEYDVSYVARSPASMRQDDFAEMIDELCNGRAATGWRLVNTMGDYGANLTLGVWLTFAREGSSAQDEPRAEVDADEDLPRATGWGEDSEKEASDN